jgi:hypothetical protein
LCFAKNLFQAARLCGVAVGVGVGVTLGVWGATWTGSRKGVCTERKHHKPRLALNNITAGVREREDENCTRAAGHLDEIQGVIQLTLKLLRRGVVGFIDWVSLIPDHKILLSPRSPYSEKT